MDTKANTDEAMTMNNLEKKVIEWEKNEFNTSGEYEEKYPLGYAPMPDELDVVDERMKKNHKFYWQKSVYDLERAVEQLQDLNEKQRANIYGHAGKYLALAKQELSESDYKRFKEELFCWLLAYSRMSKGDNDSVAYGLVYITTLNEENLGISTKTDSFQLRLAKLNSLRRAWIETVEKTGIAKRAIHCKNNNEPFEYAPNRAGRHVVETDEYGTPRIYPYPLWSSEGVDENILEKLKKRNSDIDLCRNAAKEFKENASNSDYSEAAIAFGMKVGIEHPEITNMSKLARIVKGEEKDKYGEYLNPPEQITEGTNNKSIINWIGEIDSKACIQRTK